jgi:hypothetical protein
MDEDVRWKVCVSKALLQTQRMRRQATVARGVASEVQLSDMVDNSTSLRETIGGLIFHHAAGEQVCFCLVRYGCSGYLAYPRSRANG